jgi:hypothetical protein
LLEALAAQRDPLHGLGYLGLQELRTVEDQLAGLTSLRRGLTLTLSLASGEARSDVDQEIPDAAA